MGSGGGSSQTTTVDPVYNAGMLQLSQEQQGWAAEMFNQFKYGTPYDPTEQVRGAYIDGKWVNEADIPQVVNPAYAPGRYSPVSDQDMPYDEFNRGSWDNRERSEWTPGSPDQRQMIQDPQYQIQTRTRGDIEGYDPSGQTSEMQYLQNIVNANQELLGLQTDYSKAELTLGKESIEANRKLLPMQTEVQKKRLATGSTFFDDLNQGLDVGSRMDEAQAGVQHGFKNARKASDINIASRGLDPSSGAFTASNRELAMAEASGIAGARTKAKVDTEREDFARKLSGLQLNY